MNVKGKRELLMKSLLGFYNANPKQNVKVLRTIVEQKSVISLRLLEWFVTNFAKQNNVIYKTQASAIFNVYIDYKNQLRAYSKKMFDPFCRRQRLFLTVDPETHRIVDYTDKEPKSIPSDMLVTTTGQLNFFRWAIENNVASYVLKNQECIESDMAQRYVKASVVKRKREIISPMSGMNRNYVVGKIEW